MDYTSKCQQLVVPLYKNHNMWHAEDGDVFCSVIKYCSSHKLHAKAFYKVIYTLITSYRNKPFSSVILPLRQLAKKSSISLSHLNYILHILRTKRILKKRKCALSIITRRDTSRVFTRESAPHVFFNTFLRSIRAYLKRHITKQNQTSYILLSKGASSPPFSPSSSPPRSPKGGGGGVSFSSSLALSEPNPAYARGMLQKILMMVQKMNC